MERSQRGNRNIPRRLKNLCKPWESGNLKTYHSRVPS